MNYILNADGDPIPEPDILAWARWFEESKEARRVAYDTLPDGVEISTVFLGIDHSFSNGPPILFETMIFHGKHDQEMRRYHTRQQALDGHARLLRELRGALAAQTN